MPKYAIGIVGQPRSFHQTNVYTNILAATKRIRKDADVFFCFGDQYIPDYLTDKILVDNFKPVSIERYSSYKNNPGNHHCSYDNHGLFMARGWLTLYHQILEQEEKNKEQYSIIIKLRPDVILGSYFYDGLKIDSIEPCVYSDYVRDLFGTRPEVNDISAIMNRQAMKSYLHDFYYDTYDKDAFHGCWADHPEVRLAWTLTDKSVNVGMATFKETIVRQYGNQTKDKLLPIEITQTNADLYKWWLKKNRN